MASPQHSRRRITIAAAIVAAVVLLAPASAFAGAAVDEYSLGEAGGQLQADVQRDPNADVEVSDQLGIVGENEAAESPLGAAGPVLWIGLAGLALAGAAMFLASRPPRSAA